MSNEPMELAKNWDPAKADKVLPAYLQIKYDGVPLTFTKLAKDGAYEIVGQKPDVPLTFFPAGTVVAFTRQSEVAVSVPHLVKWAQFLLLTPGASFTAECLVLGLPFKDSSGIIRRTTPDDDTAKVIGYIFDANLMARPKDTYFTRYNQIKVQTEALKYDAGMLPFPFRVAPSILVEDVDKVDLIVDGLKAKMPDIEGVMMHSLQKPFNPGKRCWGMSRYKPQPTIDCKVVRLIEAVSEAGEPLGMLGRVEVELLRRIDGEVSPSVVGVGPGKLSHDERKAVWRAATPILASGPGPRVLDHTTYAEIKYMPDPSYDALRQPTVQRFRTDKTEGDILEYN